MAFALRAVCEDRSCQNDWLLPLMAAPAVALATLILWWMTGRRHRAWLVISSAALAMPMAALMQE